MHIVIPVLEVLVRLHSWECARVFRATECYGVKQLTQADESACHPQHIGNQRRQDERAAQNVPVFVLEGVHHRHVLVLSHWLGEEKAACRGTKTSKDSKRRFVDELTGHTFYVKMQKTESMMRVKG